MTQGMRVLVVDGDANTRLALGSILKFLGAAVVLCGSSRQARSRLTGDVPKFDCTLMSKDLADGDGVELLVLMARWRSGGKRVLMCEEPPVREALPMEVEAILPAPARLDDVAHVLFRLGLLSTQQLYDRGLRHITGRPAAVAPEVPTEKPSVSVQRTR
ncbi:MAG: hypothetical protein R3F60_16735 [bacterium]